MVSIGKLEKLIGGHRAQFRKASLCVPRIFPFLALIALAAPAWTQQVALPETPAPQPAPVQQPSATGLPGLVGQSAVPSTGIHGVVVNTSGAVCEGAHVELDQAGGNPAMTTASDSNGQFSFSNAAAGPFKLIVTARGFSRQTVTGTLTAGQSFEAGSIVLAMKGTTSEVEVTASREEIAQEQVQLEETQRVLGFFPNFYVTYDPHALPLTTRQKFNLAWKSSIDPVTFGATGVVAGIEQATNSFSGYGQGMQGYAKRYGAGYADGFIATMIGGAILPSWWKQDPRYFYKGTGSKRSRALYAIANAVVCKGDNGHWQANYSAIIGGLAAGGISNLYYPASDRDGLGLTFENAGFGTLGSAVGNLVQEFFIKRLTPKIPKYGAGQP